jgi:hypothetical protein
MTPPNFLIMDYPGLRKVISGGQCGVDRGGLEAAKACGIPTGGTAPKGWRTWYGPAPELATFGLVEHFSPMYPPRTEKNICDSDATLVLASNPNSGGTALTIRLCRKHSKPVHLIRLPVKDIEREVEVAVAFIKDNCVEVLNVAGNRDTGSGHEPNFHLTSTVEAVTAILKELRSAKLLNNELE